MALRCLIVDDSGWVLAAARALLEQQGIAVVGVASSAGRALDLVHELRPDVTLIDVDLGARAASNWRARSRARARSSRPPVPRTTTAS